MQTNNFIYIRELEHFLDMSVGADMQLSSSLLNLAGRHDNNADARAINVGYAAKIEHDFLFVLADEIFRRPL